MKTPFKQVEYKGHNINIYSEHQTIYVGKCKHCNLSAYYDPDLDSIRWKYDDIDCVHEIDRSLLPDWLLRIMDCNYL